MKQQKQQRYRDALGSQAIAVTVAETFEQPVSFQLAQVLAQLPQRAGLLGEAVGLQDRFLHLAAAPARDLRAAVEQNFHQPRHAGVVNLDAGDSAASELGSVAPSAGIGGSPWACGTTRLRRRRSGR